MTRYNIEDKKRPERSKKILKEEQMKVLEKLLVSESKLSGEEQELMTQLMEQLSMDSNRVRQLRRKVDGDPEGTDELLEMLRQHSDSLQKPPEKRESAKPPKKEEVEKQPSIQPQEFQRSTPAPEKPFSSPLSEENRYRPQFRPTSLKPKPWNEGSGPQSATEKVPVSDLSKQDSVLNFPSKPLSTLSVKPPEISSQPKVDTPPKTTPSLNKDEVLAAPEEQQEDTLIESIAELPKKDIREPVEVVRNFISAWNQKAFAAEYKCFFPSFLNISLEDYVNRRMATHLKYKRHGAFEQEMGTVLQVRLKGQRAEVFCIRRAKEFHQWNQYQDRYELRMESGKWLISGVTSKIHKNVDIHLEKKSHMTDHLSSAD